MQHHLVMIVYECNSRDVLDISGYHLFQGTQTDCQILLKAVDQMSDDETRGSQQMNFCIRTKSELLYQLLDTLLIKQNYANHLEELDFIDRHPKHSEDSTLDKKRRSLITGELKLAPKRRRYSIKLFEWFFCIQ